MKYFVAHTRDGMILDCNKRGIAWGTVSYNPELIVVRDSDNVGLVMIPADNLAYIELMEVDE